MNDLLIRKTEEGDVAAIAGIERQCFSLPWSESALCFELQRDDARFFTAVYDGNIAGYMGAHSVLGEVYTTNIAVLPEYRRKGIASALLNRMIGVCREEKDDFLTLEVRKSNSAAIALYEKLGFEVVGERKDFYAKPKENALLYTLYFKDQR